MMGRLEPVCLGETVLERVASLEEQHERKTIYTNHLETQSALMVTTTATAVVVVAGFHVTAADSSGA